MQPFEKVNFQYTNKLEQIYLELYGYLSLGKDGFMAEYSQKINELVEPFKNELRKYSQTYNSDNFKPILNNLFISVKDIMFIMGKIRDKGGFGHSCEDILNNPLHQIYSTNITIWGIITDYLPYKTEHEKKQNKFNNQNQKLDWRRSDIDLIELLHAIWETNAIHNSGKKIEFKELIKVFENIFDLELKTPSDKLKKGLLAYKRKTDNILFTKELYDNTSKLIKKYKESN